MNRYSEKEFTPVNYGISPIKILRFSYSNGMPNARPHWHERMEILLVDEGEMFVNVGGREYTATADDVIVVNCGQTHSVRGKEMITYHVFSFELGNLTADKTENDLFILPLLNGSVSFSSHIRDAELTAILGEINLENGTKKEGYPLYLKSLIYRLLGYLYRNHVAKQTTTPSADSDAYDIMRYIDDNFTASLTLRGMAQMFGYDTSYFCRKFKSAVGMTPMQYINIRRMENAEQLLLSSDAGSEEIALACGFRDANYFSRLFKKTYGVTPSARRAASKKG